VSAMFRKNTPSNSPKWVFKQGLWLIFVFEGPRLSKFRLMGKETGARWTNLPLYSMN